MYCAEGRGNRTQILRIEWIGVDGLWVVIERNCLMLIQADLR